MSKKSSFSFIFLFHGNTRIDTSRTKSIIPSKRVADRDSFIWQEPIVKIVSTAVQWAIKTGDPLWHMLLTWPSGHGKTTLARLVADDMHVRVHHITAYALQKPADIVSLLNSLQANDILFIDEIHRCKPVVEEVLYVAMEDYAIDMLLPDGKPLRINLHPFTLIGATTKPEMLSTPLKNRFVYKLHFSEYTSREKQLLLHNWITRYWITLWTPSLLQKIEQYCSPVPREIGNLCKQLFDWLHVHATSWTLLLDESDRQLFLLDLQLLKGWLTPLHSAYLQLLKEQNWRPMWVKSIALSLGVHEKTVEEELEPILIKLGKIEKTTKGRIIVVVQ